MAGHTHIPADAIAGDVEGFPRLAVAHSRKVQKGEDFDVAVVDAKWTPARGGRASSRAASSADTSIEFAMFGLFDGHGGKACGAHCAERFLPELLIALDIEGAVESDANIEDEFERRLPEALRAAFSAVDLDFLKQDIHSGATATITVIRGRCIVTAAVGDSLAILDLGPGFPAIRLSHEHRLDTLQSERKRIEEAGGEVRPTEYEDGPNGERVGVGPLRVWPGGLAVSRSIGDRDGKKGGVISEPEVSMCVLPTRFHSARVVLASDGLWDAATPKQAAACGVKLNTQNTAAALNKLAQKQKDNRDDITVLVVDLLRDETMSTPFSVKPGNGVEKPVLHWPFAKKTHDPLPLPSERRADRERVRNEARAISAAIETARKADELEAAKLLEASKAAEDKRRAEAEADEGAWESVGKVVEKQEPAAALKPNQKDGKKPQQGKKTKQGKTKHADGEQRLPNVAALKLSPAVDAKTEGQPKTEKTQKGTKQKKKERSTPPPIEGEEQRSKKPVKPAAPPQQLRVPPAPMYAPPLQPMVGLPHSAPQMMHVHHPSPPGLPPMIPAVPSGVPPPLAYMRAPPPGFNPGYGLPPIMGHVMPPMHPVRATSPPVPPYPYQMPQAPLNWQQQPMTNAPVIAPPTPTRGVEPQSKGTSLSAPNVAVKSKQKRKGRKERERERAAKLVTEGTGQH